MSDINYWQQSYPIDFTLSQLKKVYTRLLPKVEYVPTFDWNNFKLTDSQTEVVNFVTDYIKSANSDSKPLRFICTGGAGGFLL